MHDSTLRRTTNVAEVFPNRTHLDASMFTWAELQQLNAGDWFLSVRLKNTHSVMVMLRKDVEIECSVNQAHCCHFIVLIITGK